MKDKDQIALEVTEKIAAVDPMSLRGGPTQAKAQIQCLVREAIDEAVDEEHKLVNAMARHQATHWKSVAEETERERDALAAFVEQFKEIRDSFMSGKIPSHDACSSFLEAAREAPEPLLLDRRDAAVRLEFAREAARRHGGMQSIVEVAEAMNHFRPIEARAMRRRQAEGGDDE